MILPRLHLCNVGVRQYLRLCLSILGKFALFTSIDAPLKFGKIYRYSASDFHTGSLSPILSKVRDELNLRFYRPLLLCTVSKGLAVVNPRDSAQVSAQAVGGINHGI